MSGVRLAPRAERDLRRIGPGPTLHRLRDAMLMIPEPDRELDVKALRGSEPWLRLRVGDYRVIFRTIGADERGAEGATVLIARVVHRRDLERTVDTLE